MNKYLVKVNGKSIEVEVELIEGNPVVTNVSPQGMMRRQKPAPAAPRAAAPRAAAAPAAAAPAQNAAEAGGNAAVTAPMPGNILEIMVKPGDAVKKGQVLLIFEAMKMENEVMAEQDGVIAAVCVEKGAAINTGDVLVTYQA